MNVPFLVVCGEKMRHPHIIHRKARGKWDAINFGSNFLPNDAEVVVLNDVDTKIHNIGDTAALLNRFDLIYCGVHVSEGPQVKFYKILDPIRKKLHIAASGELMMMKKEVFERVLPIPPCMAEDSYILFKALEMGYETHFCTSMYVTTARTLHAREEEDYKARTTLGIYQALKYAKPPPWIRVFYIVLPMFAPLLAIASVDGRAWVKGIEKAVKANITRKNPTRF